jgi:hypothetical protein
VRIPVLVNCYGVAQCPIVGKCGRPAEFEQIFQQVPVAVKQAADNFQDGSLFGVATHCIISPYAGDPAIPVTEKNHSEESWDPRFV